MSIRILGGEARGRLLRTVPGAGTRPAAGRLRASLFDILGDRVKGARVLDLFAGIGSFGFEALSRGAAAVLFIERNARCLRAIRENAERLGVESRCTVVRGDALLYPNHLDATGLYDLIFVDPPYSMFRGRRRPDLGRLIERLPSRSADGGIIILKHPRGAWEGAGDRRRYGDTEVTLWRSREMTAGFEFAAEEQRRPS